MCGPHVSYLAPLPEGSKPIGGLVQPRHASVGLDGLYRPWGPRALLQGNHPHMA
jgi:hypothetical protein